jgi:hypothetical protein
VQVDGRNFLVPVDASIRSENEVELEAMDIARVLTEMENAGNPLNVVILDACRNNPFSRSWRSTNDGLAQIRAPSGTMIAYSTAPGRVASDGAGRNAPYTAALLKVLKIPDLSLPDVFMQVRVEVQLVTGRQQTPWEASSVTGRFYFRRGGDVIRRGPPSKSASSLELEEEYWAAINKQQDLAAYKNYVNEYPNGKYLSEARTKIDLLEKLADATKPITDSFEFKNCVVPSGVDRFIVGDKLYKRFLESFKGTPEQQKVAFYSAKEFVCYFANDAEYRDQIAYLKKWLDRH